MLALLSDEERYYKDYQWCIDPMCRWGELGARLIEEIERWQRFPSGWQEREHALNSWLMAAALWQTLNDYLVRGNHDFLRGIKHIPFLKFAFHVAQRANERLITLRNLVFDGMLHERERQWYLLVERLSRCIIEATPSTDGEKAGIRTMAGALIGKEYPRRLAATRIRIPLAFRSLDLTHHDVLRLVKEYADGNVELSRPLAVVGIRTAGSYFAPLAKTWLERAGFRNVTCMSIRPKAPLSLFELRQIKAAAGGGADFLVLDEIAHRGSTINAALGVLRRRGVANHRIAVAFPVYPGHNRWKRDVWIQRLGGVRICTLPWHAWHMVGRLKPENVRKILKEYFDVQDLQLISIEESPHGRRLDGRFSQAERAGWRLKQVYRVKLWDREGRERYEHVLAKCVGWGWFGYHAYVQSDRLSAFVPPLLGLRSGLLFMKWIEGKRCRAAVATDRISEEALKYVFERIKKLPLSEDRTFREYSISYYGGQWLCALLSRPFGRTLGLLMRPLVGRALKSYAAKFPTAIDGKMTPDEWVCDESGRFWKVDYEHHGFGRAQLNIADPSYDVASFIFEFRLNQQQMEAIIRRYIEGTGDGKAKDRIIMYLWLVAHHNLYSELDYLSEPYANETSVQENDRYCSDRSHSTLLSSGYLRTLITSPKRERREREGSLCFVMNIDSAFRGGIWDFQTITMSGIKAISVLHHCGIPAFVNSSLSVDELRAYCDYFFFPGGIGEYGSVIVSRETGRTLVLIDREAQDQLQEARQRLLQGNAYVNRQYRYVVKAFRYEDRATVPLGADMAARIIAEHRLDRLTTFSTGRETVVMARTADKGTAMERLFRDVVERPRRIVTAGDAREDVPMFLASDIACVPRRMIARHPALKDRQQVIALENERSWLLEAACIAVREAGMSISRGTFSIRKDQLMLRLVDIAEKPGWARVMSFFRRA